MLRYVLLSSLRKRKKHKSETQLSVTPLLLFSFVFQKYKSKVKFTHTIIFERLKTDKPDSLDSHLKNQSKLGGGGKMHQ